MPQGTYTNYPQGFANGVSVRGLPLLQTQPGKVVFVGNGPILSFNQKAGSNNNRGTFLDPFATLQYALNRCVQGRNDIIFVMPNHRETIADAATLALDCSGAAIIGLGSGDSRPTLTFTTATTANIPVRAAGVSIQNVLFVGNFLSIASAMTGISASVTASVATDPNNASLGVMTVTILGSGTVYAGTALMSSTSGFVPGTIVLSQLTGTTGGVGTYQVSIPQTVASGTITTGPQNFAISNCEFRDRSSVLGFLSVFTGSATTNATSGFEFTGNVVRSLGTVSPTVALTFAASHDRTTVSDNVSNSAITAVTQGPALIAAGASSVTNFFCLRNRINRPNTSSTLPSGIGTSGTSWTGMCADNYIGAVPSGTGIWISTGTGLAFVNNYSQITGAADKSALINPVAV